MFPLGLILVREDGPRWGAWALCQGGGAPQLPGTGLQVWTLGPFPALLDSAGGGRRRLGPLRRGCQRREMERGPGTRGNGAGHGQGSLRMERLPALFQVGRCWDDSKSSPGKDAQRAVPWIGPAWVTPPTFPSPHRAQDGVRKSSRPFALDYGAWTWPLDNGPSTPFPAFRQPILLSLQSFN